MSLKVCIQLSPKFAFICCYDIMFYVELNILFSGRVNVFGKVPWKDVLQQKISGSHSSVTDMTVSDSKVDHVNNVKM